MKGKSIWLAGGLLLPVLASWAQSDLEFLQSASAPPPKTVVAQPAAAPAVPAATPEQGSFSQEQLEQLTAPIALYPDALVAQILMASTYPLQVVQAARWQEKNASLKDKDLDKAVQEDDWDPSVKSLLHFPEVLKRMNENLDWTQDLGDAVLAQQGEVMAAVQRLRRYAVEAGNLKTSDQLTVAVEQEVIKIEPATEVIYVPSYNPTVIYGSYWAPPSYYYPIYSYPPAYWYPPGYGYGAGLIGFGLGVAWGAAVWGDCDWHGGHVGHHGDIDIDRNTNINIDRDRVSQRDRSDVKKWEHNSANRKGVRYRDNSTAQRFNQGGRAQTLDNRGVNRDTARGYDRGQGSDRGGAGNRPSTRPAERPADLGGDRSGNLARDTSRPQTRDTARSPSYSNNAYNRSSGSFDRAASQRGAQSRGTSSLSGSSRGSSMRGGGGSMRGGGGGGRGGGRR
jgi:hypothetical protein